MLTHPLYELHYTVKQAKETIRGEVLIDSPSLPEAVIKFHKLNPNKRGTEFILTHIDEFPMGLIK